jgi:hypothetical protein
VVFGVDEVATTDAEEGETRNSRLQVFLSSLLSSFGGVFGYNTQEQEQEKEMASRPIVPLQQPGGTSNSFLSFDPISVRNISVSFCDALGFDFFRTSGLNMKLDFHSIFIHFFFGCFDFLWNILLSLPLGVCRNLCPVWVF